MAVSEMLYPLMRFENMRIFYVIVQPESQPCICCSQQAYNKLEDVLRPYSSLSYAWDEPSLPHKLVISQPGNRKLGVFNLDKVCRYDVACSQ